VHKRENIQCTPPKNGFGKLTYISVYIMKGKIFLELCHCKHETEAMWNKEGTVS
jgi:hypothetical protein